MRVEKCIVVSVLGDFGFYWSDVDVIGPVDSESVRLLVKQEIDEVRSFHL